MLDSAMKNDPAEVMKLAANLAAGLRSHKGDEVVIPSVNTAR